MSEAWRANKRKTAERGYGGRWQKARLVHLAENPLCEMCSNLNVVRLATVVDHKTPHKGDMGLFWDRSNWQSLCATHHNSEKQAMERSGVTRAQFDKDAKVIW